MRRIAVLRLGLVALVLLGPVVARADEAASHYNLALQFKREGKIPEAIAACEKAIAARKDYAAASSGWTRGSPSWRARSS